MSRHCGDNVPTCYGVHEKNCGVVFKDLVEKSFEIKSVTAEVVLTVILLAWR